MSCPGIFIDEMNNTFSDGFDIVTSYRNSKNYGDNWISAGTPSGISGNRDISATQDPFSDQAAPFPAPDSFSAAG